MGKEQVPHGSQRLSRKERRVLEREQKKKAPKSHSRFLKPAGIAGAIGGALLVGGLIFLRGQDGRVPLPPTATAQQAGNKQPQNPIALLTPATEPISGSIIEADIYKEFPELKQLTKRQSETIRIDKTNLEVLNLSNVDVNLQTIAGIYNYVHGVARQFQQNGWQYSPVNYFYNGQPVQIGITVKPSNANRRGLVLLPANYEVQAFNMYSAKGATITKPFEITFAKVPAIADQGTIQAIPSYNNDVENINLITVEACQSSVLVSTSNDSSDRNSIAHEIFCNSIGWHVSLAQAGLSFGETTDFIGTIEQSLQYGGLKFNPLLPDQRLYSQIPKFNNLFIK